MESIKERLGLERSEKILKVRRRLFSDDSNAVEDLPLQDKLAQRLEEDLNSKSRYYNFDFGVGRPIQTNECRYPWEAVDANDVPSLYRTDQPDRRDRLYPKSDVITTSDNVVSRLSSRHNSQVDPTSSVDSAISMRNTPVTTTVTASTQTKITDHFPKRKRRRLENDLVTPPKECRTTRKRKVKSARNIKL